MGEFPEMAKLLREEAERRIAFAQEEIDRGIHLVPDHLQEGIVAHCLRGRHVGHFLSAVLANDLRGAVIYGDDASLAGLKGLVQFLHNYAPGGCWGSPEKRDAWREHSGLLDIPI